MDRDTLEVWNLAVWKNNALRFYAPTLQLLDVRGWALEVDCSMFVLPVFIGVYQGFN
jgi:hypothetical protein